MKKSYNLKLFTVEMERLINKCISIDNLTSRVTYNGKTNNIERIERINNKINFFDTSVFNVEITKKITLILLVLQIISIFISEQVFDIMIYITISIEIILISWAVNKKPYLIKELLIILYYLEDFLFSKNQELIKKEEEIKEYYNKNIDDILITLQIEEKNKKIFKEKLKKYIEESFSSTSKLSISEKINNIIASFQNK
jgi:hypothetical protein